MFTESQRTRVIRGAARRWVVLPRWPASEALVSLSHCRPRLAALHGRCYFRLIKRRNLRACTRTRTYRTVAAAWRRGALPFSLARLRCVYAAATVAAAVARARERDGARKRD